MKTQEQLPWKRYYIMMTRMDAFKNYQNSSFIGRAINSKVFLEPLIRYGIMWAENPEQWTSHKKLQRVQSRINKYINFSIGEDDKYKPIKEGGGRVLCLRNLVLSAYSNFFLKTSQSDNSTYEIHSLDPVAPLAWNQGSWWFRAEVCGRLQRQPTKKSI